MKKLMLLLGIVVLTILELNWPSFLRFFHGQPDLLLVFMVSLVFYTDFSTALFFGILAGLFKDIFLFSSVAINTICFGVYSYLVYLLSRQISIDEDYVRWGIILIVALMHNFILGLQGLAGGTLISSGIFLRNLIIVSAYKTLLSPFILKFIKKITT